MENGFLITEVNYMIPTSQPGLKISTTALLATMLLGVTTPLLADTFQPIGGNQIPLWEIKSFTSKDIELASEIDDLYLLNLYVEPKPIKKIKIKTKVKAIRKGQTQLFPSEFE